MDNNTVKFRVAEKTDIDSILEIEEACFSNGIIEDKSVFLQRIEIFKDGFMVAEKNNRVVGYISAELWEYSEKLDEDKFVLGHSIKDSHKPKGNELYISSMGVLPEVRGCGLGKAQFEFFTEYITKLAQPIKSILLIVSENWTNARKIYVGSGFKEISTFYDFFEYEGPTPFKENAIVMRKEL